MFKKIIVFLIILCLCPVNVHAQDHYRFLAYGDSLIYHDETQFWWNKCGMAASRPEKDWFHRVINELQKNYGSVQSDIIKPPISSKLLSNEEQLSCEEEIKKSSETPYNLIAIEMGDNIAAYDQLETFKSNLEWAITTLKKYNPLATVVVVGNFHLDDNPMRACENTQKQIATSLNCRFASLADLNENKAYASAIGATVYDVNGQPHRVDSWTVARHPNDKGMEYIAYKVLEQIGITMDVGHDFDDLNNPQKQASVTQSQRNTQNGWITNGKVKNYYFHGIKAIDLTKIGKTYYCFNHQGALQTKVFKQGKVTYYPDQKGKLTFKQVSQTYFNSKNQQISQADGEDYLANLKAKAMSKKWKGKDRLKKAFQSLVKAKNIKEKKLSYQKNWEMIAAKRYFDRQEKAGNSQVKAAAFAYLAKALGVKNVAIISDNKNIQKGHCFVEIKGKVYDPTLKKDNYAVDYKDYKKKKVTKIILTKHNLKAVKQTYSKRKGKLTKYDRDTGMLYYANGQFATGAVVYKNKFYSFDRTGNPDCAVTYHLREAATIQNSMCNLEKIIGQPLRKQYSASCFGNGEDGLWLYQNFIITTFKGADGIDVFIAAKEKS